MASIPWRKPQPRGQLPAVYDPAMGSPDPADFLEMVSNLAGSFPHVQESEPWLAARTEITRWNPAWYVNLMEYPRAAVRFGLWVTAHAVRCGVFVLVTLAVVIVLIVHFTS